MQGPQPSTVVESGSRTRDVEHWLHAYEQMAKIRLFEETVNELYKTAKMPGLAHLYCGEEAIAVGVCEALTKKDYITSTHRGHGHCLAKGAAIDLMFAELLGKEARIMVRAQIRFMAFIFVLQTICTYDRMQV